MQSAIVSSMSQDSVTSMMMDSSIPSNSPPRNKFSTGDLVVEKLARRGSLIVLKVVEVIYPEPDRKKRYWSKCQYRLQAAIKEDGSSFVHNQVLTEELLLPFEERKSEILGFLMSKIHTIKDLGVS